MIHEDKDKVQQAAYKQWVETGRRGTLAMATGTGKTRVALIAIKDLLDSEPLAIVYIVVPTERLRDSGWKQEFEKWGLQEYYPRVRRICYASIPNILDSDLVVFDEIHNLNAKRYIAFMRMDNRFIMGLTATPPKGDKGLIINDLAPIVFRYSLQEATDNNLVAPFDVTVIRFKLSKDPLTLYYGNKRKKTAPEYKHYEDICTRIEWKKQSGRPGLKFDYLRRQRFLYNIPSRFRLAADIKKRELDGHCSLIFAPSIEFASELSPYVYSSKGGKKHYDAFLKGEIDQLATVRMLNEGHNLGRIEKVLIVAANSNAINLVQQIGRALRKEGQHAKIYILCAKDTKDEEWLTGAIADSGIQNIETIEYD